MTNALKRIHGVLATIFVSLALAACGGGGDGTAPASSIPYSGVTTQAVIDDTNAETVAFDAYEGGAGGSVVNDSGTGFPLMMAQGGGTAVSTGTHRLQAVAKNLLEAMKKIEASPSSSTAAAVVYPVPPTEGACGGTLSGSMSITLDGTDTPIAASGSMAFSNYKEPGDDGACATGTMLNGQISFATDFNMEDPAAFGNATMTFTLLTAVTPEDDISLSGSIVASTVNDVTERVVMNMVIRDNLAAKTYRVEEYTVTLVDFFIDGYEEKTITGKFYNPDYGYVAISTPTALRLEYNSDWPSAGVLRCDGMNNSWVELTFTSGGADGAGVDSNGAGFAFTYTLPAP